MVAIFGVYVDVTSVEDDWFNACNQTVVFKYAPL